MAALEDDRCPVPLTDAVLCELSRFASLAPLLAVDLEAPLEPLLTASDASQNFGFGASVRRADIPSLERLLAASPHHGFYVTLCGEGSGWCTIWGNQPPGYAYRVKERVETHIGEVPRCVSYLR